MAPENPPRLVDHGQARRNLQDPCHTRWEETLFWVQTPRSPPSPGSPSTTLTTPEDTFMLLSLVSTLFCIPGGGSIELPMVWCTPRPQGRRILALDFLDDLNGVAVGNLGTLLVTSDGGSNWSEPGGYAGLDQNLHDVLMLDHDSILVVGESPGLFRSDDAGKTWTALANPSDDTLFSLEWAATSFLSAAGEGGQFLRSFDGGWTWSAAGSAGPGSVLEHTWLDSSTGFAAGTFVAKRTNDGGLTWTAIAGMPAQTFYTVVGFLDDGLHGVLTADLGKKFQTSDGGLTWTLDPSTGPDYPGELVQLSPSDRLLALDGEGAQVWRTTDNGMSWTELLQLPHTLGFAAFEHLPGGRMIVGSTYGDLFYSDDLGATWTNAIDNPDQGSAVPISAISFTPQGHGYAGSSPSVASNTPIWLETNDGGESWTLASPSPEVNKANAIDFRGEAWGLAVGTHPSRIAQTHDGGATWISQTLPVPSGASLQMRSLVLASDDVAFASGWSTSVSHVFRTQDRGATWQTADAGLPASAFLTDIAFPTMARGYATVAGVAGSAQLYLTLDAGDSWNPFGGPLPSFPYDLVFLDELTGLFASWNPTPGIWRTDDGGASWQQVHDQEMNLITFSDSLRGLAVPRWSNSVVEAAFTMDGGLSWETVPVPMDATAKALAAGPGGFYLGGGGTKIVRVGEPGLGFCFGSPGSGTACPCANDNDGSVPGSGCANGTFPSGARLAGIGNARVSDDSLVLAASGMTPGSTGLYFQGNTALMGGDGLTFGDGLRCVGTAVVRLQVRLSDASGASSTTLSIAAKGSAAAGQTRRYQCWYRDNSGNQPCGAGVNNFNLSNGYEVTWLP